MGNMMNGTIIHRLLQNPATIAGDPMGLQPGQILQGKVLQVLPGDQALMQLGKMKVVSQLEASLKPGDNAWFHVQANASQDKLVLKVLPAGQGKGMNPHPLHMQDPVSALANALGWDDTKEQKLLLEKIVNDKVPLMKDHISQLKGLASELGADPKQLEAAVVALRREIPITRDAIQSLSTFLFGSSASTLMEELKSEIVQRMEQPAVSPNKPNERLLDKLLNKLDVLLQNGTHRMTSGPELARWLNELGVMQENYIGREIVQEFESLKSLILQAKETFPLENAGRLLHFITGQQLFLTPVDSVYQQFIFHIPFLSNDPSFVQMEGKKKQNGGLDPDNCRLLFYLQFPHMGKLLIDVKIIDRIVGIELHGEEERMTAYLQEFKEELLQSLQAQGYHLSTAKLSSPKDKGPDAQMLPKGLAMPYKGVDIRI